MPQTARAAVMTEANHELELHDYPLPPVEPGALLARVTCCTVCGSDLHTWLGHRSSPTPIILGHEIVGEIVELGAGVERDAGDRPLKAGDRITWTLSDSCGKCYFCREQGLPMKCRSLKKYGHDSCAAPPHFVGGFGEYCYITPGTGVIRLPDSVPDEIAAPANCALATVVAGWEAAGLEPLENVLIQGAGALGVYAAALAKHRGCARIIVTDVVEERLDFVRAFGASDTLNVRDMPAEAAAAAVRDLTAGLGVDAAMEVAGTPEALAAGLAALRIGGRYVWHGNVFPGATFSYDASDIIFRWLTVTGVHNYDTRHLQRAVDFLAQAGDLFPFERIVGRRFGLEEINEALRAAEAGEAIRVADCP
jgi:alcohol dehydrogenase